MTDDNGNGQGAEKNTKPSDLEDIWSLDLVCATIEKMMQMAENEGHSKIARELHVARLRIEFLIKNDMT